MLKNILKLDGTQKLSKNEQKSINGGFVREDACADGQECLGRNQICCKGACVYPTLNYVCY
jgi:hypothetical protein